MKRSQVVFVKRSKPVKPEFVAQGLNYDLYLRETPNAYSKQFATET